MSYLHSRDIVHRDIKPANVLVSDSHYKSYKYEELEMAFGKKPIVCKLGVLWGPRSIYTQTNALTGKNRCPKRKLGIQGTRTYNWRIINSISRNWQGKNCWRIGSFNNILYNIKSRSVLDQNNFKNVPNKVASNLETAFKQELQKQAYLSFSLKYSPVQAMC